MFMRQQKFTPTTFFNLRNAQDSNFNRLAGNPDKRGQVVTKSAFLWYLFYTKQQHLRKWWTLPTEDKMHLAGHQTTKDFINLDLKSLYAQSHNHIITTSKIDLRHLRDLPHKPTNMEKWKTQDLERRSELHINYRNSAI